MGFRWFDRRRELQNLCREGSPFLSLSSDIVIMDNLGSHKGKAVRQKTKGLLAPTSASQLIFASKRDFGVMRWTTTPTKVSRHGLIRAAPPSVAAPGANSGGVIRSGPTLNRRSPSDNNGFALGVFRNHPGYPTNRA
jgi:hypothetical protein